MITRLLRPVVRGLGTGRFVICLTVLPLPAEALLGALERRPVDRQIRPTPPVERCALDMADSQPE